MKILQRLGQEQRQMLAVGIALGLLFAALITLVSTLLPAGFKGMIGTLLISNLMILISVIIILNINRVKD